MKILNKYKNTIQKISNVFVTLVLLLVLFPSSTSAASLTSLSDTMSRLKISTASDHTIKYTTPSGVGAGGTITITMPAGFTIGSVDNTDIDVSWGPTTGYENELTLGATASGATWGAAFSGQVLTITSGTGTITASSKVVIEIGNNASGGNAQITNNSTAATYTISIAGTFGDTGNIAIVITTDDSIVYSATVDPSISLSFSGFTASLGALSTASVASSGAITLTSSTNAESGTTISIYDAGDGSNPGLYKSSSPTDIVGSASAAYGDEVTLVAGTKGYGIQAATNANGTGGTFTLGARYDGTGNTVGGLEVGSPNAQVLATSSSPINAREIVITAKTAIDSLLRAGSYQDTVTIVATGNF